MHKMKKNDIKLSNKYIGIRKATISVNRTAKDKVKVKKGKKRRQTRKSGTKNK